MRYKASRRIFYFYFSKATGPNVLKSTELLLARTNYLTKLQFLELLYPFNYSIKKKDKKYHFPTFQTILHHFQAKLENVIIERIHCFHSEAKLLGHSKLMSSAPSLLTNTHSTHEHSPKMMKVGRLFMYVFIHFAVYRAPTAEANNKINST